MSKLSIIIPSREERFLTPTIDDIFRNARGEIEVIAVLDSDRWPGDWKEVTARHPRLHTIHNGSSKGMRHSINVGVASAISRGATYIAKFDGHCSFGEGFDEILKAEMDDDWIVVPRRLRLEPETWTIAEPDKPPHDYHYLSFPDDPGDFGGPGLNGRSWVERTEARKDVLLDEEMSSQGSGWAMHADYFTRLQLMDESAYGPFWNEFQEIGLKCWLSGGKVMVNKRTHYAHLHKGKKYGRGYRLDEKWLQQGRSHTMKWPWNEAWEGQALPFEWLIDHFWPVPSWPENWREVLYGTRRPKSVVGGVDYNTGIGVNDSSRNVNSMDGDATLSIARESLNQDVKVDEYVEVGGLQIHSAWYGVAVTAEGEQFVGDPIEVTERLRSLVFNNSLDITINNSTLTPGQNPHRGQRKRLMLRYSFDDGEVVVVKRDEKEALIIGQPQRREPTPEVTRVAVGGEQVYPTTPTALIREHPPQDCSGPVEHDPAVAFIGQGKADRVSVQMTATALNDYLIRKFHISPYRLRAPMPIELPNFHRNDLAQLFAELGFQRGAEIGVAEGNYSEVLLKANPTCELLLVDPWHAYSDNPQNKSKEKNEYALHETQRKVSGYKNVSIIPGRSMDVIHDREFDGVASNLDFVYIDGHHGFDYVMQDLIEWSKRVRSGGIVSGDDLIRLDEKRWGAGPIEAVQAYVNAHRIPVWYVFQGHKSIDYLWVRP